jgi:hypothetical protein
MRVSKKCGAAGELPPFIFIADVKSLRLVEYGYSETKKSTQGDIKISEPTKIASEGE